MSWRDQLPKGSRFKASWELYLEEWETLMLRRQVDDEDFIDIGNKRFEESLQRVVDNYKLALKEAYKFDIITKKVRDQGMEYADTVELSFE